MNRTKYRVLLIDDDEDEFILVNDMLEDSAFEFELEWTDRYEEGRALMLQDKHDIYLLDYYLEAENGITLLREARTAGMMRPIIILTGLGEAGLDQEALLAGAADYLPKANLNTALLERSLRYALGRQQSYLQLIEERAKYRVLFTNSLDAVALLNLDFELYEVNQTFRELTGVAPTNEQSLSLLDVLVNDEDFTVLKASLQEGDNTQNYSLAVKGVETTLECLASMAKVYSDEGAVTWYQLILHDITKTKEAEREVQLAEKIAFTGRMAQLMAHEVRNPLTNINLSIQQLAEVETSDPDEHELLLGIVKRSADRISTLINQILDSSKPTELNCQPVLLSSVLKQSLELGNDRINLHDVEVILTTQDNERELLLDIDKMSLAIVNLITNSVEAMLECSNRTLTLRAVETETYAEFTITDTGIGMSLAQQQAVFEPFFSNRKGGKGLGMTLTKNVVVAHGGSIQVSSVEGQGTSFTIRLPFN